MPVIKRKKWTEHPSIVFEGYTDKKPRLKVLHDFLVDKSLPKFGKPASKDKDEDEKSTPIFGGMRPDKERRVSWFAWAKYIWDNWHEPKLRKATVEESMEQAKEAIQEPLPAETADTMRQKVLEYAATVRANGQRSLAAKLESQAKLLACEILLVRNGMGGYLEEMDMVELFKRADFGLRLDWLADYQEFIPQAVMDIKRAADALNVFDNWVVLHYDPNGKRLQEIEIEEEEECRKRDPVLFGVIQGSNRLYFVADWTTDKDDITIAKVLKLLGRKKLADAADDDPTRAVINEMFDSVAGVGNDSE